MFPGTLRPLGDNILGEFRAPWLGFVHPSIGTFIWLLIPSHEELGLSGLKGSSSC